ncbi:MAG: NADPH:quinone reductase [Vicinamibacterales bacterium]
MRAAMYSVNGAAKDVLTLVDLPTPSPGTGEVRVKVACSGVNPSDVKTRLGLRLKMGFPQVVPHSDGAGVIDAVGDGVNPSRVGDRVWIWNAQWGRPFGTAAEFVVLPSAQAVTLPQGVDFASGACLGIPALTAFHAVTMDGGVRDKVVLVAGGAGSVGHYAVQFARLKGARRIIASVSSPEKAALAQQAGAHDVINYKTEDLVARVRQLTDGRGVDRIIEVDLAANIAADLDVVAVEGDIVTYGSGEPKIQIPFLPSILKNVRFRFFIVYNLSPLDRASAIADLTMLMTEGQLTHNVAARFPLSSIVQAHETVEQGTAIGNVVVEV